MRGRWSPTLPAPIVVHTEDGFRLDYDRPKSIGRVRSFFGNVGVLVRAYALHPHARSATVCERSPETPCSTPITCSAA